MYTEHFGLKMLPFENVPDPKFFFDEGDHARIHNHIKDSLNAGRGLTVVTGPIGSGKTTLSQMIVADFTSNIKLIWMAEPPETSTDLFMFIAQELGLTPASSERVFIIRDIKDALMKINADGSKCLVIIDESHLMSEDIFNAIRLLNNLEIGAAKLIQILLLGQQEIMEIINRPEMEPFKQRIATMENMGKMNKERIRNYISYRIQVAGGSSSLIADTGWEALHLAFGSENIPRLINSLCDKSLTAAYESRKPVVDVDDVYKAAEGLGMQKEIFFYKISLNKLKKEATAPSNGGNIKADKPVKIEKDTLPDSDKSTASMQAKETPKSVHSRIITPDINTAMDKESLKTPTIFFLISLAALIFSIIFYCQRAGSDDLMSCIFELIGL